MKGVAIPTIIWIVAMFAIVLLAGDKLVGIANLVASFFRPASTVDGCKFVIPQFGRIECEPISHTPIANVKEVWLEAGKGVVFMCGDDENTPGPCKYYVELLEICDAFGCHKPGDWLQPCGKIRYNIDSTYDVDNELCFWDGKKYLVQTNLGQYIWIGNPSLAGKMKVKIYEESIRYGLNVYDSGGKWRYKSDSCSLKSIIDWGKVCKSGCEKNMDSVTLQFDDWVNYLSNWVYAPIDINSKIVTYNGEKVYCQVNALYRLKKFTTADGNCYIYPAEKIKNVECCPGMESANARCGDDFKWHPIITEECKSDADCAPGYQCINGECVKVVQCFSDLQCPGQGNWIPDYSTTEIDIVRWGCKDGQCVILERKKTECTPPNIGCPPGYVCDVQTYKCIKQVGPVGWCGDGICDPSKENPDNCPADCKKSILERIGDFLKIFLIALVISGIVVILLAYVLPVVFPPLALFGFLRNTRTMLIAWIGFAILLTLIFSIPIANIAAEVFK